MVTKSAEMRELNDAELALAGIRDTKAERKQNMR